MSALRSVEHAHELRPPRPTHSLRRPTDGEAAAQSGASSVATAPSPADCGSLSAPLLVVRSGAERGPQEIALGSSTRQTPSRATGIAEGVPRATRPRRVARGVGVRRVARGATDAAGRVASRVAGGGA
jgi:hypothetical protein